MKYTSGPSAGDAFTETRTTLTLLGEERERPLPPVVGHSDPRHPAGSARERGRGCSSSRVRARQPIHFDLFGPDLFRPRPLGRVVTRQARLKRGGPKEGAKKCHETTKIEP